MNIEALQIVGLDIIAAVAAIVLKQQKAGIRYAYKHSRRDRDLCDDNWQTCFYSRY